MATARITQAGTTLGDKRNRSAFPGKT